MAKIINKWYVKNKRVKGTAPPSQASSPAPYWKGGLHRMSA